MTDLNINTIVSSLFFGVGTVLAYVLIKWVKGLLDAKSREKLMEIDLQRRVISDNLDKLSDDDILARANERNRGKVPSDNSSKE